MLVCRFKPASPCSRQRYNTLRLIFNSLLNAETLSPFKIRSATATPNSTLKTRAAATRTCVRCRVSLFFSVSILGSTPVECRVYVRRVLNLCEILQGGQSGAWP